MTPILVERARAHRRTTRARARSIASIIDSVDSAIARSSRPRFDGVDEDVNKYRKILDSVRSTHVDAPTLAGRRLANAT